MIFEQLDDILKHFLLTQVDISLDNKSLKTNRLQLYTFKDLYIDLLFEEESSPFKLPIPFGFEYYRDDNAIYFDYRLCTFKKYASIPDIDRYLSYFVPVVAGNGGPNKFYNSIVEIRNL